MGKINDVVIPASHTASASCICVDGVALGGDINIIRSQQNGIFLAYYLNTPTQKMRLSDLAQKTTIIHLYPSHLKLLTLGIPSLSEQQKIADCLTSIDDLITAQSRKVEALKAHKKGLMQRLFPCADDEPAREPAA